MTNQEIIKLRDTWILCANIYGKHHLETRNAYGAYKQAKNNQARRARHQAYLDCGMIRVRGALGGVYYE